MGVGAMTNTMKVSVKSLIVTFVVICSVHADVDHNPLSNGGTAARNVTGHTFEAALHNPALLGVNQPPSGGLMVPGTMLGIGMWSDKLRVSPFYDLAIDSPEKAADLVNTVLKRSFDLDGLSPEEVSDLLTEEFKGGVTVYTGARMSLVNFGFERLAIDVTTHFDEELHAPEGPFMMVFSETDGLLAGNTVDFNFRQDAVWATDFTVSFGQPVILPEFGKFLKMGFGAGGIALKYVMGHSMLRARTDESTLVFDDSANGYNVDGKVNVVTSGFGFSGPWRTNGDGFMSDGLPVNGHGFGADIGGILYSEKSALSISFKDIGALFWVKDVMSVDYKIRKDSLDVSDILNGIDEADKTGDDARRVIFNRADGEYLSDEKDTLQEASAVTYLPARFQLGYSYSWDFSRLQNQKLRWLADYAYAAVNYEQTIVRTPGRQFIPRFTLGGVAGVLRGYMPVRLGFVFGGAERFASAFGIGADFKKMTVNASYKAVGHPFFVPKRGLEVAFGINFNWGLTTDHDEDGIIDNEDGCPTDPEDKDGFQDDDGCPDYDNDHDSIPDTLDKCINIPEDRDGFQDTDGCPDYDNDEDGVPDTLDKCVLEPEDRDNFNDDDGCPDPDNDGDQIPDQTDKCPTIAEDIDGFEDEDGCPEFDNDKDGIPDTLDACMSEPEVFNGYKDEDGCPDTLIRPSQKETKKLNTKLHAINFKSGSAQLISSSFTALDFVAGFLKNYGTLRYEIQGHTDSQGSDEYNLLLSAARAGTVLKYLLSKGIPEERIIGIGYGEAVPIADNRTAGGRAKNRRVEFRIVETNDEYAALKAREAEFKRKVKEAKIKGAQ